VVVSGTELEVVVTVALLVPLAVVFVAVLDMIEDESLVMLAIVSVL
jgi:hypothetical protein